MPLASNGMDVSTLFKSRSRGGAMFDVSFIVFYAFFVFLLFVLPDSFRQCY
jgi:hypothetical protein